MRLLVALAEHYVRGPDEHVYTGGPHRAGFFDRYLEVFEEVLVVARVYRAPAVDPLWARVDGPRVRVADLPDHTGPWEYLRTLPQLRRRCRQAVADTDACLLRTGGGGFPELIRREALRRGRPYAVEVVADPWDALGPGTVRSVVRPLARRICVRSLCASCRQAAGVAYVTAEALQQRYPPGSQTYATYYSSVEMPAEAYVSGPRVYARAACRLVHVGSLQHFYKAPDVLVRAVALCTQRGLPVTLRVLGDGQRRAEIEDLIRTLQVERQVVLVGHVARCELVRRELDEADLFVSVSRQEGLPRAMIEAMGRALPCLGSPRGGIPELLPPQDLVPPGDAAALADRLIEVLGDPERLTEASARNLEVARRYHAEVLRQRRLEFLRHLRRVSGG
ncbi:MAG TPA: glycosyltransferase [Phycisphaerae bacterium]|nr:glycosyltransferase [Phycisphaerae bacterium]HNU46317.1 glycosyltransferase [Phycisphaerae bacterium]